MPTATNNNTTPTPRIPRRKEGRPGDQAAGEQSTAAEAEADRLI
jgi:hypothetical protein